MKKTVLITGGLGNQLFQYTFMTYLKEVKGFDVRYDVSSFITNNIHSGFQANQIFDFSYFENDKKNRYLFYRVSQAVRRHTGIKKSLIWGEDNNVTDEFSQFLYRGFWQDIKYYNAVSDILKNRVLDIQCYSDKLWLQKITSGKSVFVHVRRGDYLSNASYVDLSQTKYYFNAINAAKKCMPDACFYVFSDDIEWCKGYFKDLHELQYVQYQNQTTLGDLALMSNCTAAIIANSSFSWWGATLKKNKTVFHPSTYYTNNLLETCDVLYPSSWIEVKC